MGDVSAERDVKHGVIHFQESQVVLSVPGLEPQATPYQLIDEPNQPLRVKIDVFGDDKLKSEQLGRGFVVRERKGRLLELEVVGVNGMSQSRRTWKRMVEAEAKVYLAANQLKKEDGTTKREDETARAKKQLEILKTAVRSYHLDLGSYPAVAEGLKVLINRPQNDQAKWKGPYLPSESGLVDPWGQPYRYEAQPTMKRRIRSSGPDKKWDTPDDESVDF